MLKQLYLKRKNILLFSISLIVVIIFCALLVDLKKELIKSSSISSDNRKMYILDSLIGENLIRKTENGYTLLDYENINDNHGTLDKTSKVLTITSDVKEDTYKRSLLPEQILFNYLLVAENKPPMEDINSLNKKLKDYDDEIKFLEKETYIDNEQFVESLVLMYVLFYVIMLVDFALFNPLVPGYIIRTETAIMVTIALIESFVLPKVSLRVFYVVILILAFPKMKLLLNSSVIELFSKRKT